MTVNQPFMWKYNEFSIGFSDKGSAFTASLFKDEIALRTGSENGFTDDCTVVDKYAFTLEICPDFHSKDAFEILCENGTVTLGLLSRLQEIDYYPLGQEEQCLFGRSDFVESMTWEIRDFHSYTKGKDYRDMQQLSRDSIRLLNAIQQKTGL